MSIGPMSGQARYTAAVDVPLRPTRPVFIARNVLAVYGVWAGIKGLCVTQTDRLCAVLGILQFCFIIFH
jgi:hypothetical protein